jgi:hypothetical protein
MERLVDITEIPEGERGGKRCAHFPSANSTSCCGKPARFEEHALWEVVIMRGEGETHTTYETRFYYCSSHKPEAESCLKVTCPLSS